jgi:F-type H+-transporting ATPase subunit b
VVLKRFAWTKILSILENREEYLKSSFDKASEINKRVESLEVERQAVIDEAKIEKNKIIQEAIESRKKIINKAVEEAEEMSAKLMEDAHKRIDLDRINALESCKSEVVKTSVAMVECLLKRELGNEHKQEEFLESLFEKLKSSNS